VLERKSQGVPLGLEDAGATVCLRIGVCISCTLHICITNLVCVGDMRIYIRF